MDSETERYIEEIQSRPGDQHGQIEYMLRQHGLSGHQKTNKPLLTRKHYRKAIQTALDQRNILRSAILAALPHPDERADEYLRAALVLTEEDPCAQ